MVKPVITFDQEVYMPGDKVSGTVTLDLAKPLKARSVFVNWWGYNRSVNVKFPSLKYHTWINDEKMLWVSKDGKTPIPAGKHVYSFSFVLPKDCPPTFKGSNGNTCYRAQAVIDIPWSLKTRVKEEFTVTKAVEEEIVSKSRNREKWFHDHLFSSGVFFSSGPIKLRIIMPHRAYKFGEPLDLEFLITNNSGVAVKEIYADFFTRAHYHLCNQHTPCATFFRNNCPLNDDQQKNCSKRISTNKMKIRVEPHSEGTFTLPVVIPEKAKTASFATGLMTFGYSLLIGMKVENTLLRNEFFLTVIIGEIDDKKALEIKAKELEVSETAAPPAYEP
ncbi:hypothetical protein GCK72_004798 [Caenorhabditis remanei]|uniref:Arrestin C-terminal-like domain-containing protein n=1 Tax=Caenorhabditis remanei TaxID=31234 RepID=A0A6A5HAP9_CAERE|nr:hypothetical protein GCK72_004798 [Caenorhabditis remanei]KAF1764848.1 hypothetical protein GCK72_004798 [Caenorhabditis remanei]